MTATRRRHPPVCRHHSEHRGRPRADLIYATNASLAKAVLNETDSLPVVFATMADPVAAGLVASLANPGRNATGVYQVAGDAAAKRFQLVREAMPQLKRMGAVFDRAAPDSQSRKGAHERAARAAGLTLVSAEFTNFEAIAKILAQFKRDGLITAEMTPSFALIGRRLEVASLAARNGIALVAHRVEWAEAGAVLTYGVDIGESHRRAPQDRGPDPEGHQAGRRGDRAGEPFRAGDQPPRRARAGDRDPQGVAAARRPGDRIGPGHAFAPARRPAALT
jgi:putative ABC transport system substrate-binding protein